MSAATKATGLDFNGACVILAEDNTMNMEIAKTILEYAGLIVDSAWNGREAVVMFENRRSAYICNSDGCSYAEDGRA